MKAALCTTLDHIEVSEIARPQIGPGELLISVTACGLCGTDIKKLQGTGLQPPKVLGHEISGKVIALGEGVSGYAPGDRVVVAHHVPCFECHYCRHGNFSMCRVFKQSNLDPGGYAEFLRIPKTHVEHTTFKIPASLSDHHALLTEPLACCVRAFRRAPVLPGDAVIMIGFGSIGYLLLELLKLAQAKVLVVDLDEARLARAKRLGAETFNPSALPLDRSHAWFKTATAERGADMVLFTAGPESNLAASLPWLRDGGTLCLFSELTGERSAALDPIELYKREITLVSSYSPGPQDLHEAFDLLAAEKINLSEYEFTRFGLNEIPKAIVATLNRQIFKAVIEPTPAVQILAQQTPPLKVPAPRRMQAVMFHALGDLRLENVEIPALKDGEVLLKVGAALTCGTDFKAYRQGHPVLLNHRLPSPFGHEVAGEIVEIGSGVSDFSMGDRVVAANSAPCDRCHFCRSGKPGLCDHLELLNGAYAPYLVIPRQIVRHNLYRLPASLPFEIAALTEPVACVVRAVETLQLQRGEHLAILGCGLMGTIFVQLAKAQGAHVTAIGRSRDKLARAKAVGADQTLSVFDHSDVVSAARALTPEQRGFDAVVEAVGKTESWEQAIAIASKGGRVCLYAGCAQGASFKLDAHRVHYEEMKIVGVFHHSPKHFKQALEALSSGTVDGRRLLSGERVALKDLPAHFASAKDRPFQKTQVIL